MELLERQVRGGEASRLMQHPLMKEAFAACEASLLQQMREVKARDKEMHTELVRRLQTLDCIRRYFDRTIADGKAATRELTHKRTLRERAQQRLSRIFSRN